MYRVILAAAATIAIAGCSLGTKSLPLSLNNTPTTKIDPNFVSGGRLGDYAGTASPAVRFLAPSRTISAQRC